MLKRIIVEEHQNPEKSSVAFDGRNKSKEFFRGYVVNQVSPSIHIFTNSVNYPNGLQFTVIPNNEKENFMQLHSNSTRNVERIDTKMYSSFCMHPLSHRSNHATKPGDEGGIPPRPLSSSQPHSLRIDSSDETCDHSCCAIDVLSAKMENLPAFVPRTPQRSESSGDDLVTTAEVTSSVIPQPVLASCDTSKTFIFKNITPYMRQTTTKPLAELVQPTVPQPTSIIANSVPSAQNLPLPHRSFSLPSTDTISSMPPQSTQCSYYDNSADIISCKDSLVAKEHHYCENTPRRLRLKTTDGPAYGLRTSYGRPGWHDNSRQSALPYPNSGTSRFYTRPAPSLPLLPLGQTQSYCRNGSRHATLNNFTNQQCYEMDLSGESFHSTIHGFKSNNEGSDRAHNHCYMGNVQSFTSSPAMHSPYSGSNMTYTAAGTAPPPKTFRGDPDQVVICSTTASGRTPSFANPSNFVYTYPDWKSDHIKVSAREGIFESSMNSRGNYGKKTYNLNIVPRCGAFFGSLQKNEDTTHVMRGTQTNLPEGYLQNITDETLDGRPLTPASPALSRFCFPLIKYNKCYYI